MPGILFFGSAALVAVLLARRGPPSPGRRSRGSAVFAAIGAYAIRGVAWWPLGAAVAVAGVARDRRGARPTRPTARPRPSAARAERSSPLNLVVVGLIVVVCVVLFPVWRPIDAGSARRPASSATPRPGSPQRCAASSSPATGS